VDKEKTATKSNAHHATAPTMMTKVNDDENKDITVTNNIPIQGIL
jgi:hypothetical protein